MNRSNPNSCAQLLELAASAQISLVIPAFSLAEPHDAVSRRTKARSRLVQDLEPQLRELGRTKALRHLPSAFAALIGVMKESGRTERQGVRQSVAGLLGAAQVIPLDEAIIRAATELQERFQISGQDAMVLASVLSDLEKRKSTLNCFMNRNWNDFDDPGIRAELAALNCKFFPSFNDGLGYVTYLLSSTEPSP